MLKRKTSKFYDPTDDHTQFLGGHNVAALVLIFLVVGGVFLALPAGASLMKHRPCVLCQSSLRQAPTFNVTPTRPLHPELVQLAARPRVFLVKDIIAPHEAAAIIREAAPYLDRSRTGGGPKDERGVVSQIRTSLGMFMTSPQQIALVAPVADRVASVVGIPKERYEAMQVLRYEPGQLYIPHPDYFDGDLLKSQQGRGGQRIATIVMYLNNVSSGGETVFPKLNVTVKPSMGSGVLFWSMNEDGRMEPKALHAATPPATGEEKWVAIYWMREEAIR